MSAAQAPLVGRIRAEQAVLAHCTAEESVLKQSGYSVRATSTMDRAMLEAVQSLPSYELPDSLWGRTLGDDEAPRRLALTAGAGRAVLSSSCHVGEDTRGRPRSYLTHALLYPNLGLLDAIRAWASPDWQRETAGGQTLPPFYGQPTPGPLDDEALHGFLAGSDPPSDQSLANCHYPARLHGDAEARKRWLVDGLRGVLRVARGGPSVCLRLVGEPGLVALLVCAAARLLPLRLMAGLTFSTFESPAEAVKKSPTVRIVGTWAGGQPLENPPAGQPLVCSFTGRSEGLDDDRDTIDAVSNMLHLAKHRRWDEVDEAHALWERDTELEPGRLANALRVREARRAMGGDKGRSALLALGKSKLGREVFEEERARSWPLLVALAPDDPELCRVFQAELRAGAERHVKKLAAGIGTDDPQKWEASWRLLQEQLPYENKSDLLARALTVAEGPLSPGWRGTLRNAAYAANQGDTLPPRPELLLEWNDTDELELLAGQRWPESWMGFALWLGMDREEGARAVESLLQRRPELRPALGKRVPPGCIRDLKRLANLVSPADSPDLPAPGLLIPLWQVIAGGPILFALGLLLGRLLFAR